MNAVIHAGWLLIAIVAIIVATALLVRDRRPSSRSGFPGDGRWRR